MKSPFAYGLLGINAQNIKRYQRLFVDPNHYLDNNHPNTISRYHYLGREILAWYADLDNINDKK